MRYARYRINRAVQWGRVEGDSVRSLMASPLRGGLLTTKITPLAEAELLAPTDGPSKVLCFGKSYSAHAAEMGWETPVAPVMFFKPPSAIIGPGKTIELPRASELVEPEGELAVVIGRGGRDIDPSQAAEHIFGYTIANDVSARDLMVSDGQWTRAKGFDTFLPLGPWITTNIDVMALSIGTTIDGVAVQSGTTADMLWSVPELIAFASQAFTLEVGDIILTGSPAGRASLRDGATVSVMIEGLGRLQNPISAARTFVDAA